MNLKTVPVLLVLFFLFCATFQNFEAHANPRTVYVPTDFPTVQTAINMADEGDTVFVHEGAYIENVVVNKTVNLIGEKRENTIIDGNNSGTTVKITAGNVCVQGFTIKGGGPNVYESGISINASFSSISDDTVTENGLYGISISSCSSNFLTRNLVEQNAADGIVLFDSTNNTLLANSITGNTFGLHLYSSDQNRIINNTLAENDPGGIDLFYSRANLLANNSLTGNTIDRSHGIILEYSSDNNTLTDNLISANVGYGLTVASSINNTLKNNKMNNNTYNFDCPAMSLSPSGFLNNIDTSNTVNGQPIYYITNEEGLEINPSTLPNAGYLALINCRYITVENMDFSDNGQGIFLAFTNNITLARIDATKNDVGIELLSCTNNTILDSILINNTEEGLVLDYSSTGNIVAKNTMAGNSDGIRMSHETNENCISGNNVTNNTRGLFIYSYVDENIISNNILTNNTQGIAMWRLSDNNTITQNMIGNNTQGLFFSFSSNNSILANNFLNNELDVFSQNSSNIWDGDYPAGGNYWSQYTGRDLNHDGIGDTSYPIDANNTDTYPLIGMAYDFHVTKEDQAYEVRIISNSTITDFALVQSNSSNQQSQVGQEEMDFVVTGKDGTRGFCRVLIPRHLLNGTYTIFVDSQQVPAIELAESNSTHAYVYFEYEHTSHKVIIIPEFAPAILLLLLLATMIIGIFTRTGRRDRSILKARALPIDRLMKFYNFTAAEHERVKVNRKVNIPEEERF